MPRAVGCMLLLLFGLRLFLRMARGLPRVGATATKSINNRRAQRSKKKGTTRSYSIRHLSCCSCGGTTSNFVALRCKKRTKAGTLIARRALQSPHRNVNVYITCEPRCQPALRALSWKCGASACRDQNAKASKTVALTVLSGSIVLLVSTVFSYVTGSR